MIVYELKFEMAQADDDSIKDLMNAPNTILALVLFMSHTSSERKCTNTCLIKFRHH